jgi:hypothetical protein
VHEPVNPNCAKEQITFGLKLAAWTMWMLPWGAVGCLLCLTGILAPLGMACIGVAAWPLKNMIATRNRKAVEYEARWAYTEEGEAGEVPWETE